MNDATAVSGETQPLALRRVVAMDRKWQDRWAAAQAFVRRPDGKPKWYVMELPPFTTGGLHLGHARNYVLADAGVRFRRMAGYDVLYTTGYDSFGLPSELAARESGLHPADLVEDCIISMGIALRQLGLSHDTNRITPYHHPEFYRWVQWVFLRLLEAGHCERREEPVLWCTTCDASLAESLLDDDSCWRCRTPATKRTIPQWFVKEAHFAEALLAGLDDLTGWPETVRRIHADWIGRRTGRMVRFETDDGRDVDVFAEDNVTFASAAAIGLPLDHALAGVAQLKEPETGLVLPTATVPERLLPAADIAIPLVPGLNPAVDRIIADMALVDKGWGQEPRGKPETIYRLRDWSIARQRYWGPPVPVVHCPTCGIVPVPEDTLPVLLPRLDLKGAGNPLASDPEFLRVECPQCRGEATRDSDTFEAYSSPWWYHWTCMESSDGTPFDRERAARALPVDVMIGGNDQIRSCFFHVRMIAKALASVGVVDVKEPVDCLIAIGMIRHDGQKMSKSAGNAIVLDDLIAIHGADAIRMAVLAAAAPERDANWSDGTLNHFNAFLARTARFGRTLKERHAKGDVGDENTRGLRQKLSRWVEAASENVTQNFIRHHYHLIPRNLEMLFDRIDQFSRKVGVDCCRADEAALQGAWSVFLKLLSPLAPHLAEELWELQGHTGFISHADWPLKVPAKTRHALQSPEVGEAT
jgi:leucyl-tRNA synthetase